MELHTVSLAPIPILPMKSIPSLPCAVRGGGLGRGQIFSNYTPFMLAPIPTFPRKQGKELEMLPPLRSARGRVGEGADFFELHTLILAPIPAFPRKQGKERSDCVMIDCPSRSYP